ncbi:hypothetical protein Hanom_Chr16g01456791 [Helianthus anomalus]
MEVGRGSEAFETSTIFLLLGLNICCLSEVGCEDCRRTSIPFATVLCGQDGADDNGKLV